MTPSLLNEKKGTFFDKSIIYTFSVLSILAIAMSPGIKSAGQLPVLILFFLSLFFCFRKSCFSISDYAFISALIFMVISAIPQAIMSQQGQPLDGPSRYLIAAIIFIGLSHIKTSPLLILYGVIGSALITIIAGGYEILTTNHSRLDLGIGIIESGTILSMILSITLPFVAISNKRSTKSLLILVILTCLIFMVFTGARGSWLAATISVSLFIFLKYQGKRLVIFSTLFITLLIASISVYYSSERFSQRIDASITELNSLHDSNKATSTNLRLLMWAHAWEGFKQGPLFGISYEENARLKRQSIEKNNTTEVYSADGRGSAHNEILTSMLYKGIVGLIALLFLYLVPLSIFLKQIKNNHPQIQALALAGTCCVTSAFISGLTEAPLMHTSVATTFAMMLILIVNGINQLTNEIAGNNS